MLDVAMPDRIEDRIEDVARTVVKGAGDVLAWVAFSAWMAIWLLVALVGWIFTLPTVTAIGASVAAATILIGLIRRSVKRRRLERRAEKELIARAQLERVKIDRDLQDTLRAFDLAYKRVTEILEAGDRVEETLAVEAAVDLERVRNHLFEVARVKTSLIADLKALGRSSRVGAVSNAIDDLRARISDRQREAERITRDTQQLAQRLVEVSALAPKSLAAEQPHNELSKILGELDRTAKAYKEIEEAETEAVRKLRAARALRNASSSST